MIPVTLYQIHRFFMSCYFLLFQPHRFFLLSFVLLQYRPSCSLDFCSEIHIITSGCANIFLFTVSSTGTLP
jgi:hypothetical protein